MESPELLSSHELSIVVETTSTEGPHRDQPARQAGSLVQRS